MRKLFQNNQGSTLPVVLTVFFIVIIFSVTALTIGTASVRQAENQEQRLQAYYLARSGASAVASYIVNNPDKLSEAQMNTFISKLLTAGTSEPFKLDPDDKGEIEVSITKPSENLMLVSSTAAVDNISQTTSVEIIVEKATGEPFNKVVYSFGKMHLNGTVIGALAGLSDVSLDWSANITSTLYMPSDAKLTVPPYSNLLKGDPPTADVVDTFDFPVAEFPDFPSCPDISNKRRMLYLGGRDEYTIQDDVWYQNGITVEGSGELIINRSEKRVIRANSLKVSGGGTLTDIGTDSLSLFIDGELTVSAPVTLQLGDQDINIVTNDFSISSKLKINRAEGKTGKLNIYVKNKLTISGGSEINHTSTKPDEASRYVNIYYAGSSKVTLANGAYLSGMLQIEKADLEMSGGYQFYGDLISGGLNIKIDGGSNADSKLIYAPAATVKVSGGANVKGCIVAKFFELNNATVNFMPVHLNPGDLNGGSTDKTTYRIGNWY